MCAIQAFPQRGHTQTKLPVHPNDMQLPRRYFCVGSHLSRGVLSLRSTYSCWAVFTFHI